MADWVRLPACLWVLETTRSAPGRERVPGSASLKARCAPHASSTTSGTPWACATRASAAPRRPRRRGRSARRRSPPPRPACAPARRRARRAGRSARCPSPASTSGATKVGRSPARTSAVDRAAVDGALHDDAIAVLRDRQARREVALRGAVGEQPRPPRAPRLGGQPPRALVRRRRAVGRDVDALDQGGEVERERLVAQRRAQPVVRREAALVAGHHRAARAARGEREQRLEIGRRALAGMWGALGHRRAQERPRRCPDTCFRLRRARLPARARAARCAGSCPSASWAGRRRTRCAAGRRRPRGARARSA